MNTKSLAVAAIALATLSTAARAAMPGERTGEDVVKNYCAMCHATGVRGAPKVGDAKAWEPRAAKGLSSLTKNALDGVRQMPPHGGVLSLNDTEMKRAITYMVNHSGGSWIEPIDRLTPPAVRTGEQVVRMQCAKCHDAGLNGAPRIGDKDAWIQRARLGLDSVTRSAIHGHGAMPSRGGMADLTDAEMRSAIAYMFQRSVAGGKTLP